MVDCDVGRLTIVGLVTSFKSTAVLSTGHGVSTPHRYQRTLSPGTGRSSARDRAWSPVIKITIAHVGPALAADAAATDLHAGALCRLAQAGNCRPGRPAQED